MQRAQPVDSRMSKSLDHLRDPTADRAQYGSLGQNDAPPSPASSTGTPVFVTATPRSDSPTSMADSWVAVTPNSDDERPRSLPNLIMTPDLALAVEGLRIHEHEESFLSEGEDDDDEDLSIPPSEDASEDDEDVESSDEETILAPRTHASLNHPVPDDALRASLSTLLKSKDATSAFIDDLNSPHRRSSTQGPMGIESLSLVNPEEFATRTSLTTSRASSAKSHSRLGKKSHSKRSPRSTSKSRNKDNAAQVYALWTAAITAGFLVGFGAGYAWKEYLAGSGTEDVRRVGCVWCGDTKR